MHIQEFVMRLKLAVGRNTGAFIAWVNKPQSVDGLVNQLNASLQKIGVPVCVCDLQTGQDSRELMKNAFQSAVEKNQGCVLLVWSMEHQSESNLKEFLRWLNQNRENWSQVATPKHLTVPIVLVANQITYREYIGHYANDLWDCAHPYLID